MMTDTPWISVIGIGADGVSGLSPDAHTQVARADVLAGGARQQAMVADFSGTRIDWSAGLDAAFDAIAENRGKNIVVLATGDPMFYGVGAALVRRFGEGALDVRPAPGAVSLAAARMNWSLPDVGVVTIHGRPLQSLALHLAPNRRLIVLAHDGDSPADVASLLCDHGFGESYLSVLENIGSEDERIYGGWAHTWPHKRAADLNTICIACAPRESLADNAQALSRVAGLTDDTFENDGQLTKREVRATVLALLGPCPGEVLWDIGAGAGSVAIEWLRADTSLKAIAIERDEARAKVCELNAKTLGVPKLKVVVGAVPQAYADISTSPDAVFVGGATAHAGVLDGAWDALGAGGRLVAAAVTQPGESALASFHARFGGEMIRLRVERLEGLGATAGFRPLRAVTLYKGIKS